MYNALQPGVFALSGWDLCGMLTLDRGEVAELIADGDTRWINRGAHDLMGIDPAARLRLRDASGRSLYGPLPEQLKDPQSFARRLRDHRRPPPGIATSVLLDVPDVSHRACS